MSHQAAVFIELKAVVLITGAEIQGFSHEDLFELVLFDLSADGLDGKGTLAQDGIFGRQRLCVGWGWRSDGGLNLGRRGDIRGGGGLAVRERAKGGCGDEG